MKDIFCSPAKVVCRFIEVSGIDGKRTRIKVLTHPAKVRLERALATQELVILGLMPTFLALLPMGYNGTNDDTLSLSHCLKQTDA